MIINKDKILSSSLYRAGIVFSSRLLNTLLTFLFTLLAGKLLSVEDHGFYGQSLARMILIQTITEAGLQFSIVRFLTRALHNNEDPSALIHASLLIKVISAFLAFVIITISIGLSPLFSVISPGQYPDSVTFLWMVFLGGTGMSLISYLDGILVSHEKYGKLSLWIPSVGFLRLFLLLTFVIMENHALRFEHVIYSYVLAPYLASALFFLFFSPSFFIRKSAVSSIPWMKKLFTYNFYIVIATFFSITSDWMEVFLIHDPAQNGLFNAARIPMQGFVILFATMQSILLPMFSRASTRDDFKNLFLRIYKFIIPISLVLIPFYFVLRTFIPWWYGPEYYPSIGVFSILYPNYSLRIFFAPLGTALFAFDKPVLIAIEAGLRMFFGIFFNLIFIPLWGIEGAAWASLLAQFSGWIFLIVMYASYFRTGHFLWEGRRL